MINELLLEQNMTKYRLSKLSDIPYTTINDICSNKADIKKCSVDTVYKIAKALNVSVEEILAPYYIYRPDFELFKSSICHKLKELGDTEFLIDILESKVIIEYVERKWYPEALYMLAMLDYVSRENNVPICTEFDEIRKNRLSQPVFPASVISRCVASGTDDAKTEAIKNAIPEFLRLNIVESEVRNVI